MTYIEHLNAFNQWLESNTLPVNAQLMFFKLLNVFNKAGWPELVQVDNLRMMSMIGVEDKRSMFRARDQLMEAGIISFKKGTKGKPSQYKLGFVYTKCIEYCTPSGTPNGTPNGTASGIECGMANGTHIKTKTKTKKTPSEFNSSEPVQDSKPPVILLPLNDGTEYSVTEEQCHEWAGLYPAVDVIQQLRGMRGWLLSNKTKRKTARGIERFITSWLAKEQDRGGQRFRAGKEGGDPYAGIEF